MNKHLMSGLILATLLTGCKTHVGATPDAYDVETAVKSGLAAKTLPAGTKTIGPKAQAQAPHIEMKNPKLTPVLSNKALATGAAGGAGATGTSATGTPHFKLTQDAAALKLIPLFDDANQLTGVMASPTDGTLCWYVQAIDGPITVKTVRLTIRREALAQPPQPTEAPDPQASPVPQQGEPMTFEQPAADWGITEESHEGASCTLKLDLKGAEAKKFLMANMATSRASITITLLDAAGKPIPGDEGSALTLKASISVL